MKIPEWKFKTILRLKDSISTQLNLNSLKHNLINKCCIEVTTETSNCTDSVCVYLDYSQPPTLPTVMSTFVTHLRLPWP